MNNIKEVMQDCHQRALDAGWWDGDVCTLTKITLIHSEISEAMEGLRKDLMDDHLPHRKMEEVEIADTLIRTFDLAGYLGLIDDTYETIPHEDDYSEQFQNTKNLRNLSNPALLGVIHSDASTVFKDVFHGRPNSDSLAILIERCLAYSIHRGFDIEGAIQEKLAYNALRADHKPENRAKQGGKKF